MNEIDKNNGKRHREKIINLIKQKDTSLEELKKNTSRQSVLYHVPKLCEENVIRAYIKGNGLKDKDIFYTFVNRYEYPQDVKKLIDDMCNTDIQYVSQAFTAFVSLCIENGANEDQAKRLAYLLMSKAMPGLENSVPFSLIVDNKLPEAILGLYPIGWNYIPFLQPKPIMRGL